jgi:hypothetical protein
MLTTEVQGSSNFLAILLFDPPLFANLIILYLISEVTNFLVHLTEE